jgi:putative colanic acid biosysnthesis UDP-glucose lipid carrier transferase
MDISKTFLSKLTLQLCDIIFLNVAALAASAIVLYFFPASASPFSFTDIALYNLSWFLIASLGFRLYSDDTMESLELIFRQTWRSLACHALCMWLFFRFYGLSHGADKFVVCCYIILSGLFIISRLYLTYLIGAIVKRADLNQKVSVIGNNEANMLHLSNFFEKRNDIYNLVSVDHHTDFFTSPEHIKKRVLHAVENDIKVIYSTIIPDTREEMRRWVTVADQHCVRLLFVPQYQEPEKYQNLKTSSFHTEYINELEVISLRKEPLNNLAGRVRKRGFDILFSSFVIIFILSWLTPIIALLIKLESRGPVFFKQLRSGKDNKPFLCYKFRSMTVNSNSDELQAVKNDARVTKLGAFLRKTSLDELPQFFNVLSGTMSIVGPRPHMLKHTEQYSSSIDQYMVRQFLKPGITGWAQVNGYRGETTDEFLMKKRVRYDVWYLENWSLMLDVRIVFLTIINLSRGEENAY